MYSLNTGWQQGWRRAVLALGQLRGRRQQSEDPLVTPGLPGGTWQGLQPRSSLHGSSRAGKPKGKTTIRQLCWLCCVPGSALWSSPETGERHLPAFQGFVCLFVCFPENHSHGSGNARATGSWFFGLAQETDLELSFSRI